MDHLPVEILEMILEYVLWDNPEELYPLLRTVSSTWKLAIERSRLRVFQYWYNRCKTEIPEDHIQDIVQAKYPLIAQPWRECYWVDSNLAHVPKNVYSIWKNLPDLNDGLDLAKYTHIYPLDDYRNTDFVVCMNDKYFAVSSHDYQETRGTRVFRWDNLQEHIRQYDVVSSKIDFYTTKEGTFIVLERHDPTIGESSGCMSKYPIDRLDLPSELIEMEYSRKHCITQNECFCITEDYSTGSHTIEHKILTEHGFETSTIVERTPVKTSRCDWEKLRVEISRCSLYVIMQIGVKRIVLSKYKISRNSDGKLLFTLEERKVVTEDLQPRDDSLYCKVNFRNSYFMCDNLHLTDSSIAADKFHPWLSRVSRKKIVAHHVHANYVFCSDTSIDPGRGRTDKIQVRIFHKDSLTQCLQANDPAYPECSTIIGNIRDTCHNPSLYWIGIIYIGLKAKILVHYYAYLCLIDFY